MTVNIVSNSPPSVSITNPVDGTTFVFPAMILIQARASDADGSVTNVQFFDGTNLLGNTSAAPFQVSVPLAVGQHSLTHPALARIPIVGPRATLRPAWPAWAR